MTQPTVLRIGGVPEHFNLPWHLAIERGEFSQKGVDVQWCDYPAGTGAMMHDLQQGQLDVAIALTEGAVAGVINQQAAKVLQFYVTSPLVWGIHVAAQSPWQEVSQLEGKRYAISRMGSGSHLMAFVHAQKQGWDPGRLSLVTVGGIEGARKALAQQEADVFLWEKYMTKPLVDNGEFRRVGECPTPWPCFIVVASSKILQKQPGAVAAALCTVQETCRQFMADSQAPQQVANRYHLQEQDAQAWFQQTTWATVHSLSRDALAFVIHTLYELGTIAIRPEPEEICFAGSLLK